MSTTQTPAQKQSQQNNKRTLSQLYSQKLKANSAPKSYLEISEEFIKLIQNLRNVQNVSSQLRKSKLMTFETNLKRCIGYKEKLNEQIYSEFQNQLDTIIQQRLNSVIPLDIYIGLSVKKILFKLDQLEEKQIIDLEKLQETHKDSENKDIQGVLKELKEIQINKSKKKQQDITKKPLPQQNQKIQKDNVNNEDQQKKKIKLDDIKQKQKSAENKDNQEKNIDKKKPQTPDNKQQEDQKQKQPDQQQKSQEPQKQQDQSKPQEESQQKPQIEAQQKPEESQKPQPPKKQQTVQEKFSGLIQQIEYLIEEIEEEGELNLNNNDQEQQKKQNNIFRKNSEIKDILENKKSVQLSSIAYKYCLQSQDDKLKLLRLISQLQKFVQENSQKLQQKVQKIIQILEKLILIDDTKIRYTFNTLLPIIVQNLQSDIQISQYKGKINTIFKQILTEESEAEGTKFRVSGVKIFIQYHDILEKYKQKTVIDALVPQIAFVRHYNKSESVLQRTWKDKIFPTQGKEKMIENIEQIIEYQIQQCYSPNKQARLCSLLNLEELTKVFLKQEAVKNNITDIIPALLNLFFDQNLQSDNKETAKRVLIKFIDHTKPEIIVENKALLEQNDIKINY